MLLYSFLIHVLRAAKMKLNVSVVWRGRSVSAWGWKKGLSKHGTRETSEQLPPERFGAGSMEENSYPLSWGSSSSKAIVEASK